MTADYAAIAKEQELRKALWESRRAHKPTRGAFLMASASDPILAMCSAPYTPTAAVTRTVPQGRRK